MDINQKYEPNVFKDLDTTNTDKIMLFLLHEKCDFIEDIVNDYLDLFTIDYNTFVEKYHLLNNKYNGLFLKKASEDMNLLEELYN